MKLLPYLFTGANLVGLYFYTHFVRAIQYATPAGYSDASDSIAFVCTALPILAACLLLNFVWGILGLRDAAQFRGYLSIVFCTVITVAWITTILV